MDEVTYSAMLAAYARSGVTAAVLGCCGEVKNHYEYPIEYPNHLWNIYGISMKYHISIDWFKGKNTGKSHDLHGKKRFPVDVPSSQPIDVSATNWYLVMV